MGNQITPVETSPVPSDSPQKATKHLDIAKWLIPSVSALFLLIGYAGALGHYSLIGFDPGLLDATSYTAISASFLGALLSTVTDLGAWWESMGSLRRAAMMVLSIGAAVLLIMLVLEVRALRRKSWPLVAALVAILLMKGITLDAPLFQISDVLVAQGGAEPGAAPFPLHSQLEKKRADGGLEGLAASEAIDVWSHMICMRVDRGALAATSVRGVACELSRGTYASRVAAEFLANLVATSAILGLAAALMVRAHGAYAVVLASLSLVYSLTLPYAYGKLVHPTAYDFGDLALKTRQDLLPDIPKKVNETSDRLIQGFVLVRDSQVTTIATLKPTECKGSTGKSSVERVKLWRISNSEILWQREIYREDVISWKLLKERDDCAVTNY